MSNGSLRLNILAYVIHLDAHSEIDPRDLAYTVRERRSVFSYRISFPATTLAKLKSKFLVRLEDEGPNLGVKTLGRSGVPSKALGNCTGQGAQYARIGAELINQSPLARDCIQ